MRIRRSGPLLALVLFLVVGLGAHAGAAATHPATLVPLTAPAGSSPLAHLPLAFEPNRGQVDHRVAFLAHLPGGTAFLTRSALVLTISRSLPRPAPSRNLPLSRRMPATQPTIRQAAIHLSFQGANPHPAILGQEQLPGRVNYFIGNDPHQWHTNIPTYADVLYRSVYPGIDLAYHGSSGALEYDWILHPGAQVQDIRTQVTGATLHQVAGGVILRTAVGSIRLADPVTYEQVDGRQRRITSGYRVEGARLALHLGPYDHQHTLIVDPSIVYSTYLGGHTDDLGNGIAVDRTGDAYVTGYTTSSNFPARNALQSRTGGSWDAVVTEIAPHGSSLVYSTYLGGSATDAGQGIAIDGTGNAYVTGYTISSNFPTTNAFQRTCGSCGIYDSSDAFVAEIAPHGSALIYSTFLGGSGADMGYGIAIDGFGNAYVTGETYSANFPTTNAIQPMYGGGLDAFVTEIAAHDSSLVYSTYLGGAGEDGGQGIAVDGAGNAYVTGSTTSPNFPIKNAIQPTYDGGGVTDAFVTEIAAGGSSLVYSTFLGGSAPDMGRSIAVDNADNAYVTGQTVSSDFPTKNPLQPTYDGGGADAFVTEIAAGGSSLVYSTYLGGNDADISFGIAVDGAGNAYVTGSTASSNFPTRNAIQSAYRGGGGDAFVAEIAPHGSALVYSTFLGGSGDDQGRGIAVDGGSDAYVTGETASSDFPTTNAIQPTFGGVGIVGAGDAFITELASVRLASPEPTPVRTTPGGSRRPTTTPTPTPTPRPPTGQIGGTLDAVTCVAANDCWAVGTTGFSFSGYLPSAYRVVSPVGVSPAFGSAGPGGRAEIAHWNGIRWSMVQTPLPAGEGAHPGMNLMSVTCASRRRCWAVGYDTRFVGHGVFLTRNLALRWNGARWSIAPMPQPAGTRVPNQCPTPQERECYLENRLYAVACNTVTSCWAVGYDVKAIDVPFTFSAQLLHWNGSTWSATRWTGAPSDLLLHVACPTPTRCWSADAQGVLTWNGRGWQRFKVTGPQSQLQYQPLPWFLDPFACPAPHECWFAGADVALHLAGSTVSVSKRVPFRYPPFPPTPAITCTSVSNCWVVHSQGAAWYWNGARWAVVSVPPPSGANHPMIYDVACGSATACWAVGQDTALQSLILRWNGKVWTAYTPPS